MYFIYKSKRREFCSISLESIDLGFVVARNGAQGGCSRGGNQPKSGKQE